uniref:Uncharacterized protein n=1 Tax=Daphnia magna TaxID=35525 RepID=A0A0P6H0T1_9CRUS
MMPFQSLAACTQCQTLGTGDINFQRRSSMKLPSSCPNRLMMTAKNLPHPQEMSMYSLCSFYWKYMRMPSSRNVEMRQEYVAEGTSNYSKTITNQ